MNARKCKRLCKVSNRGLTSWRPGTVRKRSWCRRNPLLHDVNVVNYRARLAQTWALDHAAELGVAEGADHGEDAGDDPDDERHVDTARVLETDTVRTTLHLSSPKNRVTSDISTFVISKDKSDIRYIYTCHLQRLEGHQTYMRQCEIKVIKLCQVRINT